MEDYICGLAGHQPLSYNRVTNLPTKVSLKLSKSFRLMASAEKYCPEFSQSGIQSLQQFKDPASILAGYPQLAEHAENGSS